MTASAKSVVDALIAEDGQPSRFISRTFQWTPYGVVVRGYPSASKSSGVSVDDLIVAAKDLAAVVESLGQKHFETTVEANRNGVALVVRLDRSTSDQDVAADIRQKLLSAGFRESKS